jgi:hypothetical protein
MPVIESLRKGWSFMKAAAAMAREDRRLLAPSAYLVLSTILYFAGWIGALVAIDPQWSDGTWTVVGIAAVLGSFLLFYFCCGMTVTMVDAHLRGERPSLAGGARAAARSFPAIVLLAIVSTAIDTVSRAARDQSSVVGRVVAALVQSIWTLLSFLMLPAIILERASFGAALRRVRELHRGHVMLIGVGEIGVRLVTNLIGLVWFLLIFAVVYGAYALVGGTAALVIAFVAGGAMLALFAAFSTYLRMAYYTCLYLWAVEVERTDASAPAPLPLAIALGRAGGGSRAA